MNPTTVLVGNDPILSNRDLGRRIDSFAAVVRFNNFPVGNAADHGYRTTHHATAVGIDPVRGLYNILTVRPRDYVAYSLKLANTRTVLPCPPMPDGRHGSSGLAVALAFIATGQAVALAGFDHGATGRPNTKAHDWQTEREIFRTLENRGLVTYL